MRKMGLPPESSDKRSFWQEMRSPLRDVTYVTAFVLWLGQAGLVQCIAFYGFVTRASDCRTGKKQKILTKKVDGFLSRIRRAIGFGHRCLLRGLCFARVDWLMSDTLHQVQDQEIQPRSCDSTG